ncbi:hypothetical protein C2G38_2241625 [Gigaspora rosea]|uniref:Uncharacterized protein n=1 Tax=Gigaspora rosea TaxID=44941 RepID=A0A397VT43_9GLOM|nr:hypothetical protein C2G38_2241625 [Gigaspora rosea]
MGHCDNDDKETLYDENKKIYIQSGIADKLNEDIYKEAVTKFFIIDIENSSFFRKNNVLKQIIALKAAEFKMYSNRLNR